MTTLMMTFEEARRNRESARDRLAFAERQALTLARTMAEQDTRLAAIGRLRTEWSSAALLGDELIVRTAVEHEAWADWQDARELCGHEAMAR